MGAASRDDGAMWRDNAATFVPARIRGKRLADVCGNDAVSAAACPCTSQHAGVARKMGFVEWAFNSTIPAPPGRPAPLNLTFGMFDVDGVAEVRESCRLEALEGGRARSQIRPPHCVTRARDMAAGGAMALFGGAIVTTIPSAFVRPTARLHAQSHRPTVCTGGR
jgi:hypothetical protein